METVTITVTYYMFVFFTSNMEVNTMRFRSRELCMAVVEHVHSIANQMADKGQCYEAYREEPRLIPSVRYIPKKQT